MFEDRFYEIFRKVVAPGFASMSNSEIDCFALEADMEINQEKFGKRYLRALANLTAHLKELSDRASKKGSSAATGQLKRVKTGMLEREYSTDESSVNGKDSLNLTVFGKEYYRLRKANLKSPIFVSCS